jgi:hypothetical protein
MHGHGRRVIVPLYVTEEGGQPEKQRKVSEIRRDTDYGMALAYAGQANRAQRITADFSREFPEETIVQFNYLRTLRAKLALNSSNPQQALDALHVAAPPGR